MFFLQHLINQLIGGRVFDNINENLSDHEAGIPSNVSIWTALKKIADVQEKKVKAIRRGGILFQQKEDRPDSEIEAAIMVYVFYTDHTWSTFFFFADGTNKEMPPPGADHYMTNTRAK